MTQPEESIVSLNPGNNLLWKFVLISDPNILENEWFWTPISIVHLTWSICNIFIVIKLRKEQQQSTVIRNRILTLELVANLGNRIENAIF